MYAALAPDTPAVYSSPVDAQARTKLDEAYALSVDHFRAVRRRRGATQAIVA